MLSHHIVFLRNNARPHSAKATQDLLLTFHCDVFPQPQNSLDLAASHFRFFPYLKTEPSGEYFTTSTAVNNAVLAFLRNEAAIKCLGMGGNYTEKKSLAQEVRQKSDISEHRTKG